MHVLILIGELLLAALACLYLVGNALALIELNRALKRSLEK